MSNIKNGPIIGLIGGTGWPSTEVYLHEIPRQVQKRLGGLNSPNVDFQSRNFAQIDEWVHEGNWEAVTGLLTEMALQMKKSSNISALAILSNTLHKVAPQVAKIADVPLIHIGECTAKTVKGQRLHRVGFIGTKFTMQDDFILECFRNQGIKVFTPPEEDMNRIDEIIFRELCQGDGKVSTASRDYLFQRVVNLIAEKDIKGVILGCTELGLVMTQDNWSSFCSKNRLLMGAVWQRTCIPFIDTTNCHIEAIVDYLCREQA